MNVNDTITNHGITFIVEEINDGSIVVLAKMGKRGALLKPRWLARLRGDGTLGTVSRWF